MTKLRSICSHTRRHKDSRAHTRTENTMTIYTHIQEKATTKLSNTKKNERKQNDKQSKTVLKIGGARKNERNVRASSEEKMKLLT